ncbi:MAG TPA: TolC family protein [Candidatus Angelobacter sp.]
MSLIVSLRNSRALSLLAISLMVIPSVAQNTSPSQQAGNTADQQAAVQSTTQAPEPQSLVPPGRNLPPPTGVNYSKPKRQFPNLIAPYVPRPVPPPLFGNTPRIDELLQGGKIMLSMDDAIALALANNLDLAIARYNLPTADTDILLTQAGGSPRGINTGVVQGTPGGTGAGTAGASGGGAGGTSAGAGGAGAGGGGIVQTTSGAGPSPDNFDPILSGTVSFDHGVFPLSNTVTSGTAQALQNTTTGNFTFSQGFSTGTLMSVTYDNNRQSTNSPRSILNPTLNSSFRLSIRQHLLQGFGPSINRRLIVQARNNKKSTEESFRQQVISTVTQIQNIYWDLVAAYEDVKVKEQSLALAQKTLSDNQKQVQIGTLAPIEIVRAQSSVAQAEQDLLTSRTNLQLQELFMKNAVTRNLPNNSTLMQAAVVPTDTVAIPDQENLPSVDQLIQMAYTNRPDYIQSKITLKNDEINIKGANNGLLPSLDVIGFYGASSLAGPQNPLLPVCVVGAQPPSCVLFPGQIFVGTTGFGDAFTNLFNSSAPDKGVAFTLTIPIRNRAAQAVQVRSQLEYRQAELRVKQLENQIGITVRNDQFAVFQNRARVVAAREAQRLAAQTMDAEQKKYALGASTYFNVLTTQRDLAQAESNVVVAEIAYAKSKVQLDADTAQTLDRNNISLPEATVGVVKTPPHVPGLVPNTFLQNQPAPTQQPGTTPPPEQQPPQQKPPQ